MPKEIYLYLHIVGLVLTAYTLGVAFYRSSGQDKRKWPMMLNGIGILLILLGGFGMAAKMGFMTSFPVWMLIKIGLWVVLAGLPFFLRKAKTDPAIAGIVQIAILALAAYLGIFKPLG